MSLSDSANITFDAALLQDPHAAMQREWLVANGLGGYASSSVGGANTRRYHGLLVAALDPPLGRAVLLSKLEETMEIVGPNGSSSQTFGLSVNMYPGVTYPQGYRHLEEWRAYPAPTWIWSPLPGVLFEKRIWMAEGKNTTYISYCLLQAPEGSCACLHLVPLLAGKDYHSEMHPHEEIAYSEWRSPALQVAREPGAAIGVLHVHVPTIWNVTREPVSMELYVAREDGSSYPDVAFDTQAYWYYRFFHQREQERGLDCEEDLFALGMFTATLPVGETFVVMATVEPERPDSPQTAWDALVKRQETLLEQAGLEDDFGQRLTLAAEAFLVQGPHCRSTVIAGYPWFCDWGRDTMIALPGLCLATGQTKLAKDILLTFAAFVDQGMLPNRFPDVGQTPEYNTVDATLWYFVAIYHYVTATGDMALIRDSLWEVLERIIQGHQQGTRYNIHADTDSLLYSGQPGVQLTWMDAKVGDWVVTPRIGKAVEINALWHNALKTMAHFARLLDNTEAAKRYSSLAQTTAAIFAARFPRPDGEGLYDVLDTPNAPPDGSVRPNQIFAVSLPFAPLEATSPVSQSILKVVHDELLTEVGLRSLSPQDPAYRPRYEGDTWSRDGAYHQGTIWTWLLGAYAEAHYKITGDREGALEVLRPLQEQMTTFGVGSLAEIFDGDAPHRPNGCFAQAWSVSETLRVWKWLQTVNKRA